MSGASDRFGLPLDAIQKIETIFKKNAAVEKVVLYGSRAKGNFKLGSDIDLTLVAPKLVFQDILRLANEIDDLLLPYKVDLSLFHLIENTELQEHIQRVGLDFSSGKKAF